MIEKESEAESMMEQIKKGVGERTEGPIPPGIMVNYKGKAGRPGRSIKQLEGVERRPPVTPRRILKRREKNDEENNKKRGKISHHPP